MRTALLIHYHSPQQLSWIQFQTPEKICSSRIHTTIDTLPTQCYPIYVLLSGTQCTVQQVQLPTKMHRQRLIQAIPYMLEEQLAQDIDSLHFAIGKPQGDCVPVAVVSNEVMQTCLQALQQHGIQPTVVLPEMLALPYHGESTWSVMLWDTMAIVRTASFAGFTIEQDSLAAVLQTQTLLPDKIHVFSTPQNDTLLTALHSLGVNVEQHSHVEKTTLVWFLRNLKPQHTLNCLQNNYLPHTQANTFWKKWRWSAVLAAWLGILLIGQLWLDVQQLKRQRQALTQQINQVYKNTFPEAQKIVNARAQMEQRLLNFKQQKPVQPSFLQLLKQISPVLAQAHDFQLKRLDYRRGNFDLHITVADLQTLEKIKQQLSRLQFQVEINAAVSQNNIVKSRLRIRKV